MDRKQRIVAAVALVGLIALAVGLNRTWARRERVLPIAAPAAEAAAPTAAPLAGNDSFTGRYRLRREETHREQMGYLNAILEDGETEEATRRAAQEQLMALAEELEAEITLETLLEAQGFPDTAVALHDGVVNIMVAKASLTDAETARILDAALRTTRVEAADVRIIPVSDQDG